MQDDLHKHIRQLIDQSLAGAASSFEQQTLRDHLATCSGCSEYLETSNRAIAGLRGFSFEIDPALDSRVVASISYRAQQLEERHRQRGRLWRGAIVALLLTIVGSAVAIQLGARAAAVWHLSSAQFRLGLTACWIAPSVWICLLLLLMPVSAALWTSRKGVSR